MVRVGPPETDLAAADLGACRLLILGLCGIKADLRAALNGGVNGCTWSRRIVARALALPEIRRIYPFSHNGVIKVDVVAEFRRILVEALLVAHVCALEL